MRPHRLVLLVVCFIAIPVFLTCVSLLGGQNDGADVFQHPPQSRLRALFSFSTPSALFPPSAIISLTFENSTFFLARPAAFGPSLPSKGLSGQLWIGRGFGDDTLLSEDDLKISGFELGCSDVPGWGDDQKKTPDNPAVNEKAFKKSTDDSAAVDQPDSQISSDLNKAEGISSEGTPLPDEEDGTDDHLHRPLADSNPAPVVKPGEPANSVPQDKSQKSTHADIESLQESADIAGKIVMLSRGGCGFLEKVKWTQRRGGIALIVGDNERTGQLTIMYAKGDTSNITIPAIFTSYTSAHLLSTLVPPESDLALDGNKAASAKEPSSGTSKNKNSGPVFTSIRQSRPTTKSSSGRLVPQVEQGWMQNVLQVVGFDDAGPHAEDSRRPPGSGNIEWVQVKDWDDDAVKTLTTSATQTSTTAKTLSTTTKFPKQRTTSKAGNDDFVIGVQDWRDTELIAPKSTSIATSLRGKKDDATNTATVAGSKETELKGGSIIPGSGEYQKPNRDGRTPQTDSAKKDNTSHPEDCGSVFKKIRSWFHKSPNSAAPRSGPDAKKKQPQSLKKHQDEDEREGLWVTLTPTSVSTSPFFDTLLVLVVSPLVTLTFVYGLLLLRSRIRRRRWRAPKSVVDRLPVRTYHTMAVASSTTSSQLPTPDRSQAASPQLRPDPVRARQRSQTIIGVLSQSPASSASSQSSQGSQSPSPPPAEKQRKPIPKRYRGRQIECVVCLEEYVDGESKVMSLPCGHEFHAECITPWLVNRRRTCPICKGDVVRSMQRSGPSEDNEEDNREPGDETADTVQERVATTIPDDTSTASIPIPDRQDVPNLMDQDVERGEDLPPTEQNEQRPIGSRWRGIINASLSNLSGDTLWRTSSVDRNR